MIAHISIGVKDIDISKRFYDAALEPLGYKYLRAARSLLGYGYGRGSGNKFADRVTLGLHEGPNST